MPTRRSLLLGAVAAVLAGGRLASAAGNYSWLDGIGARTLESAIRPPAGFARVQEVAGSFAAWLRGLPLKEDGARVKLFNGDDKPRQDAHAGIIDIDVGKRDLQQCADAVMRLRAEWLFNTGRASEIAFNVTEGGRVPFSRWANGERPSPSGKSWKRTARADASYESFRNYMNFIFSYAGTESLEKELKAVEVSEMGIGDVFIKGGFPGHAVLVADIAENAVTQARRFLLIQSYMPAQDIHILKNPANGDGSPWYAPPSGDLFTPEWTFPSGSLKRWPDTSVQ